MNYSYRAAISALRERNGKRPCDCTSCDCSNSGDTYSTGSWDGVEWALKELEKSLPLDGPSWLPFNINDYVRVKLTDTGRSHLRAWTDELNVYIVARGGEPLPYREVKEDAEGWSEWQAWDLMSRLGEHCAMGREQPFETNILVKRDGATGESSS